MTSLLERTGTYLLACCSQPRYRTAWLIGSPLSGKTTLARELCRAHEWQYRNYTTEQGLFDALRDRLETYQPSDLLNDLSQLVSESHQIVLVDEIDAVLAIWSSDQRRLFANQASRLANLPHGLVLVSNFFTAETLVPLLPDSDLPPYINLGGVQP